MIVVFYINGDMHACYEKFSSTELSLALTRCQALRKEGMQHVVISSEPGEHVGKLGVDTVANGRTPDGEAYDWSKADRAGKTRRGDEDKPTLGKRDGN
jgi:hypothetical protein